MQSSALSSHLRVILEHQGQGLVDREQTLALSLLAGHLSSELCHDVHDSFHVILDLNALR